jgi:hypothetical protein
MNVGAQGTARIQSGCGLEQAGQVLRRVKVWDPPHARTDEEVPGWQFVARIFGVQMPGQQADDLQTARTLGGRGGTSRPLDGGGGTKMSLPPGIGQSDEAPEQSFGLCQRSSHGSTQIEVGNDVVGDHGCLPGQGWATVRRELRSTRA